MVMGETRLAEREAYVAAKLGGEEMTADEIRELTRLWDFGTDEAAARMALEQESALLELFGGISHRAKRADGVANGNYLRTAGEMEAAWKAARETVETGRQAWQAQLLERRDRRAGKRGQERILDRENTWPSQ